MTSSIFLIGFMASGKSRVGRSLSKIRSVPFVDLDLMIEEMAEKSIAQIFEEYGEAGFRSLESEALKTLVLDKEERVVATGGGTPFFGNNLKQMQTAGIVVHLSTELETCLQRAKNLGAQRPLLAQSPIEIASLFQKRAPVYRRADVCVSTDNKSIELVSNEITEALLAKSKILLSASGVVALGRRSYPCVLQPDCLPGLGKALLSCLSGVSTIAVLSDDNVFPLYGDIVVRSLQLAGYKVVSEVVSAGESSKCMKVYSEVCESLIENGLDRSSVVVALGGGVIGDLAGFVAATLFRGITFVQVPTTILAMTDSSIGGKTGINSQHGKNLLGAFWQPSLVWADPFVLATLSKRERRAAFGEIVKYALLDEEIWHQAKLLASEIGNDDFKPSDSLTQLLGHCMRLKASIVSADERERGLRATLNLGHTIGHAIESYSVKSDSQKYLVHGEAVALGLLASCRVSHRLGYLSAGFEGEVATLLKEAGLDVSVDCWLSEDVLQRLDVDKKRTGKHVRFVVVAKPGDVRTHTLELSVLKNILLERSAEEL